MSTHFAGRSFSVLSTCFVSCTALDDAAKAPLRELTSDLRIENIVLAAPTSMVPTAMGRMILSHTVYAITSGLLECMRFARSGSKNRRSGIKTHHANTPPETLM